MPCATFIDRGCIFIFYIYLLRSFPAVQVLRSYSPRGGSPDTTNTKQPS